MKNKQQYNNEKGTKGRVFFFSFDVRSLFARQIRIKDFRFSLLSLLILMIIYPLRRFDSIKILFFSTTYYYEFVHNTSSSDRTATPSVNR
jgi:hypothetical protein